MAILTSARLAPLASRGDSVFLSGCSTFRQQVSFPSSRQRSRHEHRREAPSSADGKRSGDGGLVLAAIPGEVQLGVDGMHPAGKIPFRKRLRIDVLIQTIRTDAPARILTTLLGDEITENAQLVLGQQYGCMDQRNVDAAEARFPLGFLDILLDKPEVREFLGARKPASPQKVLSGALPGTLFWSSSDVPGRVQMMIGVVEADVQGEFRERMLSVPF